MRGCFFQIIIFLVLTENLIAQQVYVGTSMGFADYLENSCGIVYKENGVPTDPYFSLANHGATVIRLHVHLPPFSSSYSNGEILDFHSVEKTKVSMQKAKDAGLKTLLTFTYQSFALEDSQKLNDYVAPLAWQSIASDLDKITDSVYLHTYTTLDDYCNSGLIPEIVSIGSESVWRRLEPNLPEEQLPPYDPARSVAIHNAGSQAVRDISSKYGTDIKVCFHMMGPSRTKWWLEEHWPYGLNFDMIGISLYHGWNNNDYAGFESLGEYVDYITSTYNIDFIVMETAQLYTSGGSDGHVDILGLDNIPPGYDNPPTTETQKQYLTDITNEVINNGGAGVIVWGGEWVGSDCYVYPDQWGKGSSWENKTFWDFNDNLQDGVNWMMAFSGKVPVTFKVDMQGADTSKGIFITGDFENMKKETWKLNPMNPEGNHIYQYTTYMIPGSDGAFYFLNDTIETSRETIPPVCAGDSGTDRKFNIPLNSSGEIFAFIWEGCDSIPQFALSTDVYGQGSTSPTKGIYSQGVQIAVTAAPALGWQFNGWLGDTISSANPILITMNSDFNIAANFIKLAEVPVTFKVDMTGVDATNGVYVTGEFPNQGGKTWQLNKMIYTGDDVYQYKTNISIGSSGPYYFLNDDKWGVRESVPAECALYFGSDRGFNIPVNSTGETFAFLWSSCEEIGPSGNISPVDQKKQISIIYPNPTTYSRFSISLEDFSGQLTVSVLDFQGRYIYCEPMIISGTDNQLIELPELASGVYLVRIYFEKLNLVEYHKLLIFK
jgi:arabinogalactan endo-1,4-beta-galactosidase